MNLTLAAIPWVVHLAAAADEVPTPYLDELVDRAHAQELHRSDAWRKLVHYRQKLWGRRSQADARSFFAAPHGKLRPEAELDATLAAFFAPPVHPTEEDPLAQHPQCRWRARYTWLVDTLEIDPTRLPPQPCERHDAWVERLDVDAITLIYADAYLGNPASMFGHTFLRLDRDADRPGAALVANAAEFSATPWTTNPLLYPILGLSGGFRGTYSTLPYYMKVRQYGDSEQRDLWEYRLALSPEERVRLLDVLWEMGGVHFDYYYLKENCSYHLLGLFEAMRPELDLQARFPVVAFPVSTVRAVLDVPGFVDRTVWRPSSWTRLDAMRDALDPDERRLVRELVDGADPSQVQATPERAARILDAAVAMMDWSAGDRPLEGAAAARQRALLGARGRLGVPSPELVLPEGIPPESGHRAATARVTGGASEGGAFARLTVRPALHDMASRVAGFIPGSELEMMGVTLRADPDVHLERLGVFSATSLNPIDPWRVRPSWRARVTGAWDRTGACLGPTCWAWTGTAGIGPSVATADRSDLVTYAFLEGVLLRAEDRLEVGPQATVGAAMGFTSTLRLATEGHLGWPVADLDGLRLDVAPKPTGSATLAWTFTPQSELRFELTGGEGWYDADGGVALFF